MKKILPLLLACSFLALFAACGANPQSPSNTDPGGSVETSEGTREAAFATYTNVSNMLKATSGADAQYDIDMKMDMDMTFGEETMTMSTNGNIKMKVVDGKTQYSMVMDMGDLGSMEIYSDGEDIYCTMNGVEQVMDMSALETQLESSVNMPDFEEDALKSFETETVGSDTKTTLVIDGGKMTEFIDEMMGATLAQLGEDVSMDIEDISCTILSDSADNPKSMDMDMTMRMSAMGEEIEISAAIQYIFNHLGSGVDIDLSAMV